MRPDGTNRALPIELRCQTEPLRALPTEVRGQKRTNRALPIELRGQTEPFRALPIEVRGQKNN